MTLTTTPLSHAHALSCRDRIRTVALPAAPPPGSLTMRALAECLRTWSLEIRTLAGTVHRDWSEVVRLHLRVEEQDRSTAEALWR